MSRAARSRPRPLLVLATLAAPVLLAAALAGCASGPDGDGAGTAVGTTGHAAAVQEAGAAAGWPDGHWVEYRVTAPTMAGGTAVAVARGGVFTATTRGWAIEEATRGVPILGAVDPVTLASSAFGGPWDVLQLPLEDGERWTATVRMPDDVGALVEVALELNARRAPVATPTRQEDGFLVEGRSGGRLVLETSYSPSMHLPTFTRLLGASGNVTWQAVASAEGDGWDGPLWTAAATGLVEAWSLTAPDESLVGPPTVGGPLALDFQAAAPGEVVYGDLVAVAFGGAQDVSVVTPSGRRLSATVSGSGWEVLTLDEPTEPGRWQVAAAGAGVVAFAGVFLWSVAVAEVTPSGAG